MYVITGTGYEPSIAESPSLGTAQVRRPTYLFKLVYDETRNMAWAHWCLNDNTVKGSKPISYAELVQRTGVQFLPGVRRID